MVGIGEAVAQSFFSSFDYKFTDFLYFLHIESAEKAVLM